VGRRALIVRVAGVAAVAVLALGGGLARRTDTAVPSPAAGATSAPSAVLPSDGQAVPTATRPQTIVRFGPEETQEQFAALLGDMNVDVIEMDGGTYRGWHLRFAQSRAARPLLVRPAPGAQVVWDDLGGDSGDGLFHVGWGPGFVPSATITDDITFDPTGTGGTFTVQNYQLGQVGLISTAWADHVTFNGFTTRNISGIDPGWLSWQVYVSSDGVHAGSNLTFNDWNVGPSSGRVVGGLQTYHDPQARNVTALRWSITGAKSAMTLYGGVTELRVEDWTISDSDYPVTSDGNAAGVLRANRSTGSANAPVILPPLVDGGGNSWH
jgi:hypothetical protein